jgi:hypothetical protein
LRIHWRRLRNRGDNFNRSNAIPKWEEERDWPIRILSYHLAYHLNPIWHGLLRVKLSLQS